ncbi:hypothetical protein N0V82_001286 [Gnomoniopsis sp. IMI 355080]|nr:hypothetical protein N0V82_001286 [Gnomoniopsis sp. IMI 355080]
MQGLPSALMGLIFTMLTKTTTASLLRRSSDSASAYTDTETNITFLGYAPPSTGFKFGMALPSSPTTDLIAQIISPLNDDGSGYGAIDFGSAMEGFLMIAAWPDSAGGVKVSPRIATGYEVSNGANLYTASNITITPIASGTFVNETHVAATFVCGGCIVADSFQSAVTKGSASTTFSYAYSLTAVSDPSDVDTQLSDHTLKGELYGPFDVTLKSAESSQYESWVALTKPATGTATASAGTSGATSTAASAATSDSGSGSESSSSGSSSSSSSSTSSTSDPEYGVGLSPAAIVALVGLGFVYVLQAVQII